MIVAAVVLPLTFSMAYAKGGNAHKMPLKEMLKQLDLTSEQQADIKKIMQSSHSELKKSASKGSFHNAKMNIIKADKFDETQAGALIDGMQALKKDKKLKKMQMVHEVYHTLTAEQQAKMDLLFEQHHQSKQKKQKKGKGNNK